MQNKIFLLLFFSLFVMGSINGQSKLTLNHKTKPKKQVSLDLKKEYTIKTNDTVFFTKKIVGFNDSTLLLTIDKKTDKDTTYHVNYYSKNSVDTFISPIYIKDTIVLPFSNIEEIKVDRFKKKGWLILPATLGYCALIAIPILPIVNFNIDNEGMRNWLQIELVLASLSGPPLLIGTSKKKYNLTKNWFLSVQK